MNTRQKIFGAMAMLGAVTVLTTSDAEARCVTNKYNIILYCYLRGGSPVEEKVNRTGPGVDHLRIPTSSQGPVQIRGRR